MIRRYDLLALAFCMMVGAAARDQIDAWVDRTVLPSVLVESSVEVRDWNGALLRVFPVEDGRIRMVTRLADVDPSFVEMLIAYEDKRFHRHAGVDPLALMRAFGQAVWNREVVSGGSTLTMQTARLLENSGTGRWRGKLRQIRVALALERHLSKDQILEIYLSHAPYGGPYEGLRAGALAWFGKPPARLTSAEAALLVALPQSPETRRPDRFPDQARKARMRVLDRVNSVATETTQDVPVTLRSLPRLAPHLSDRILAEAPRADRIDLTLDAHLQKQMEALAQRAVHRGASGLAAAIVVADHQTGEVRASVGSPNYGEANGTPGFVDMTRAIRSPGSTLKPFVYALAFDQRLAHPDTLIDDVPVTFGPYAPQNFDGLYRGTVTMRTALQLSLNIPPVLLLNELGPAQLMALLRKGGTTPRFQGDVAGLGIALGGLGVSLNDLVQLYGGLAGGGNMTPLVWVKGQVNAPTPFMSESAAWQIGSILSGVPPPVGFAREHGALAYKTGTSYGHRDAWAIGFDGTNVIGVWLGRPDGTPVPGAFGGAQAAPVLFEAFSRLKPKLDPLPPPPPETVIVTTSELPAPLRRFRSRDAAFVSERDAPQVTFPPTGAELEVGSDGLPLKIHAGLLPLTVFVNGAPVATNLRRREVVLPFSELGYAKISVVDAAGRGASVDIRLQ